MNLFENWNFALWAWKSKFQPLAETLFDKGPAEGLAQGLSFLTFFGIFRSGNHHFPAHVLLVMQFIDRPQGFVEALHIDKRIALGTLGARVVHDFYIGHGADTFEEFDQIGLGGVVREIADIKTR